MVTQAQDSTTIELLTPTGAEFRRVSAAPARPPRDDEIPLIDITDLDGDLEARKSIAERVRKAAENTGFFYVQNYGIDHTLTEDALSQAKAFLAQSLKQKALLSPEYIGFGVGYRSVSSSQINRTESRGSPPGADALYIHYPPPQTSCGTGMEDIDVGIGSHTDIQLFTLLWQDDPGGLQVLSNTEEWLDASPIPRTLVVNVGDSLQRLSNDRFRSTAHKVYNRAETSRYSMPFFFWIRHGGSARGRPDMHWRGVSF